MAWNSSRADRGNGYPYYHGEPLPPLHVERHLNAPSIGRIVHYQRYGSPGGEHKAEPSPAIITAILNAETMECQLFVMNPNGVYFNPTPFSAEPKPGHWNWPPYVKPDSK